MDGILVIAAGWQFRALLRAQLIEEGFEVRAWPALELALAHLFHGDGRPQMIVVDMEGIEKARMVWDLWHLAGQVPLLLCGGAPCRAALSQEDLPPATILMRPFRVRDVVRQVRKALSCPKLES